LRKAGLLGDVLDAHALAVEPDFAPVAVPIHQGGIDEEREHRLPSTAATHCGCAFSRLRVNDPPMHWP
jgi:hypothetical protein